MNVKKKDIIKLKSDYFYDLPHYMKDKTNLNLFRVVELAPRYNEIRLGTTFESDNDSDNTYWMGISCIDKILPRGLKLYKQLL